MKTEKLIKAADELNALLFDPPEIDTKADEAEVKAAVKEAAKLLEPDDELTKDAVAVLQELGVWINQDETEDAEEVEEDADEVEEVTLVEAVESATSLKELKELAKVSDEFKELRSELTKYKTVEALQKAMLTILALDEEDAKDEPEEEEEQEEETLEAQIEAADSLKQLKVLLADDTFADHYEELKGLKLVRVLKDAMMCVAKTGVMTVTKKSVADVEKKKPSADKKEKKEKKEPSTPKKVIGATKEQIVAEVIKDLCIDGATVKMISDTSDTAFHKKRPGTNEFISPQRVKQMLYALVAFDVLEENAGEYMFKN